MAVIVELFGPPGAGKTTFAKALAARLQADGVEVGLHLSSRPGEAETGGLASAGLQRIARPVWELIAGGAARPAARTAAPSFAPLLANLGRRKQLRMRQYLFRLAAAWAKAEASPGVIIFDQAYLQFLATVLALDDSAGANETEAALRLAPRADLALRVEAAQSDLASRLDARLERVGALGRLLEAGAGSVERYLILSQLLQDELEKQGRAVLKVRSSADGGFAAEIERAAEAVDRRREAPRPVAVAS
jgi:RecA/RadA recombinase